MQEIIDRRRIGWIACVEMSVYDVPGLGAYEKLVYTILCGFANKNGAAFPTIQTLARKASCSDRKVRQVLRTLEENGLIKRRERTVCESLCNKGAASWIELSVKLNANKLKELFTAIETRKEACFVREAELASQINACETAEEAAAAVWPE